MVKGKIAIITGSSTGIGAVTAIAFAKEGAAGITLHGRQVEKLQSVKRECEKIGGNSLKVRVVIGDITDENIRKKMVEETVNVFGRVDVLVNNAGVSGFSPVEETALDKLDKFFDVNVRSVVALTQLAIPHLVKTAGCIVNVSSIASLKTLPTLGYYSMSKSALDTFTKHLAVELGPKGVRVNSINPGAVPDTEIGRDHTPSSDQSAEESIKRMIAMAPLRRVGKPGEIADSIVYLASENASFITGAILPVDGGLTVQ